MTAENTPDAVRDLLPIWKDDGLGDRIYKAMHAYLDDYVFSPDEGSDHEPNEFERLLLEDFFNGAISDEAVNAILQEAARAMQAAMPAPAGVRVKALEWVETSYGLEAQSIVGTYRVMNAESGYKTVIGRDLLRFSNGLTNCPTKDEAKAAAQADYERRILSAIEDAGAREGAGGILIALKAIIDDPHVERLGSLKLRAISAIEKYEAAQDSVESTQIDAIQATQITIGRGLVDVGDISHDGKKGILLRPRPNHIPIGEPGEVHGQYWPVPGDVVIWIDNSDGAAVIREALEPFLLTPTPAGAGDLVERLRTKAASMRLDDALSIGGAHDDGLLDTLASRIEALEAERDSLAEWRREASDTIVQMTVRATTAEADLAALRAEVERLREALSRISGFYQGPVTPPPRWSHQEMAIIARAALAPAKAGG